MTYRRMTYQIPVVDRPRGARFVAPFLTFLAKRLGYVWFWYREVCAHDYCTKDHWRLWFRKPA